MDQIKKVFVVHDNGQRIHYISMDFDKVKRFVFTTAFEGRLSIDVYEMDTIIRYPDFYGFGVDPKKILNL